MGGRKEGRKVGIPCNAFQALFLERKEVSKEGRKDGKKKDGKNNGKKEGRKVRR